MKKQLQPRHGIRLEWTERWHGDCQPPTPGQFQVGADHRVDLQVPPLLDVPSVLGAEVAVEVLCAEAGRIHGEVGFERLERCLSCLIEWNGAVFAIHTAFCRSLNGGKGTGRWDALPGVTGDQSRRYAPPTIIARDGGALRPSSKHLRLGTVAAVPVHATDLDGLPHVPAVRSDAICPTLTSRLQLILGFHGAYDGGHVGREIDASRPHATGDQRLGHLSRCQGVPVRRVVGHQAKDGPPNTDALEPRLRDRCLRKRQGLHENARHCIVGGQRGGQGSDYALFLFQELSEPFDFGAQALAFSSFCIQNCLVVRLQIVIHIDLISLVSYTHERKEGDVFRSSWCAYGAHLAVCGTENGNPAQSTPFRVRRVWDSNPRPGVTLGGGSRLPASKAGGLSHSPNSPCRCYADALLDLKGGQGVPQSLPRPSDFYKSRKPLLSFIAARTKPWPVGGDQ